MKASPAVDREAKENQSAPLGARARARPDRSGAVARPSGRAHNDRLIQSRSIDEIDRDEIMAAIRDVFKRAESLDAPTAFTEISHALGFRRTGARITEELRRALRTAIRRHIINRDRGVLSIECRTIDDYTRDELIETLLAAMGKTWWSREDAVRAAARRLGFRRTGNRSIKAFRSAINGAIRRGSLKVDHDFIRRT